MLKDAKLRRNIYELTPRLFCSISRLYMKSLSNCYTMEKYQLNDREGTKTVEIPRQCKERDFREVSEKLCGGHVSAVMLIRC